MTESSYQSKRPTSRKIKERYAEAKKKYAPQIKSGALKFFEAVKKIKVEETKPKRKLKAKTRKTKAKKKSCRC